MRNSQQVLQVNNTIDVKQMQDDKLYDFSQNNRSRVGNKVGGSQINALRKNSSSRYNNNGLSKANLDSLNKKKSVGNVMNINEEYEQLFPGSATIQDADDKAYADIRIKLGNKKSPEKAKAHQFDAESLPSDISDDMWGELPKYQSMLHQEQIKKERADHLAKKALVKDSLGQQIAA